MSEVVMPTSLYMTTTEAYQARFDVEEVSEVTGHVKARVLGPPRWGLRIGCDQFATPEQANEWEAMVIGLRGRINYLSAYDPGRRVPRGSMRGSLVVGTGGIVAGATTLPLSAAVGTLQPGDLLQIGTGVGTSMLIKVMAPVTAASGVASVPFEPPSRYAFSAGTTVVWDHPRGYYRAVNKVQSWAYNAGNLLSGNFNLDLIEVFA